MANDTAPLVSIYIPTRNRPEMLFRAVQSCLQQSYPAVEIIVVDDASDQAVQQQLSQQLKQWPNVKFLTNASQMGACFTRNLAIAHASGEFITGLDDDDEFETQRIAEFVRNWRQEDGFLCSGYQFILTEGRMVRSGRQARPIEPAQLLEVNLVGNQIFTKTAYLKDIGGFDPELVACQDYDVWIRLALAYGGGRRLASFSYIVHQEHEHERISTQSRRLLGHQQLIDKHQHLMSAQQISSQLFYRQLQSGAIIHLSMLSHTHWRHWLVILKVWVVQKYSAFRRQR